MDDRHLLNETEGGDRLCEQRMDGGVIEKEGERNRNGLDFRVSQSLRVHRRPQP